MIIQQSSNWIRLLRFSSADTHSQQYVRAGPRTGPGQLGPASPARPGPFDIFLYPQPILLLHRRHSSATQTFVSPLFLMHHHKLFSKTHGFLQILRIESQTPKSLYPISYFHYSKSTQTPDSKLNLALKEIEETQSLKLIEDEGEEEKESQIQRRLLSHSSSPSDSKVEIFHPWPEWVELMESLLKKDYFVGGAENGFHFSRGDMGLKESNRIRTGCLNFARDRFDLIRYWSIAKTHLLFYWIRVLFFFPWCFRIW